MDKKLSPGKKGAKREVLARKAVLSVGLGAIAWVVIITPPLPAIEQTPSPMPPPTVAEPTVIEPRAVEPRAVEPVQSCEFLDEPQQLNTQQRGDTIVIGRHRNRRYQVIIPGSDTTTLKNLHICVRDAFISRVRWGAYIQVGSFASRSEAEAIHRVLRREGYRSRVIYSR